MISKRKGRKKASYHYTQAAYCQSLKIKIWDRRQWMLYSGIISLFSLCRFHINLFIINMVHMSLFFWVFPLYFFSAPRFLSTKLLATIFSGKYKSQKVSPATISQLIFSFQLKVTVCLKEQKELQEAYWHCVNESWTSRSVQLMNKRSLLSVLTAALRLRIEFTEKVMWQRTNGSRWGASPCSVGLQPPLSITSYVLFYSQNLNVYLRGKNALFCLVQRYII